MTTIGPRICLKAHLTKIIQKEVFQMANHNLSLMKLLGGLSVNLNHLKRATFLGLLSGKGSFVFYLHFHDMKRGKI